ncbi:MAG: DUF1553 domain-containing protein [Planctomycetaceae bacterium]|nr:DUF1553 domain-containing protein [Planctomycetaceae bacterium]
MRNLVSALFVLIAPTSFIHASEPPKFTEAELTFFESKIRPVLVEHCHECHSADSKILQGGLRVDHRAGLLTGGDSGAAIDPDKPADSLLLKALRHDVFAMPPKGKLPDSIIRDFETWIAMGVPDPREAVTGLTQRAVSLEEGRRHWAFQIITDPPVPAVSDSNWSLDPLDHFVLAKLDAAGLRPVADANRHVWLRRVSLDLTGLPPTPADIDAFVRDDSPDAYAVVVDRLLGSRAFGERWARHWLDLTGYADMMGTSNNVFAEHAWRYRDYLIDAYAKDKPFDRFVREQIAGDLMPAGSPEEQAENITATGFLMVGDVEIVEPDKAKMEADHIDTQVTKIGMAFLGMTLGCVRCHDHKFDPITLPEYYGIAGILRSSPATHKIPFGVWSRLNATDLPETSEQLAARTKQEAEHEAHLAAMNNERSQLETEKGSVLEELKKLEQAASAGSETVEANKARAESLTKRRDEIAGRQGTLGRLIQHAEFFRSKAPRAYAMHDGDQPADMPIYIRGNPYAPGAVVPRSAMLVPSWEAFPEIPAGQSGRLQLAEWLADRRNPLTPRVAVNRIWQKLFGEGIVRSVDYFGTRGDLPSHPELLDHLATRFLQNGWSQKQLIRDLVLSRTYRLSSTNDAASAAVDPDSRLLWRMNPQRLDAEALRDSLLAISGELIASNGGPGLVLEDVDNCGDLVQAGVNPPNYAHRKPRPGQEFQRTIYLPVLRINTTGDDRIRTHFDFVNPAQIAGQRSQTVVPTQALFVMNGDLFRKRAKGLADSLLAESPETGTRLEQLWLRVVNRPISDAERSTAAAFLTELGAMINETDSAARDSLAWQELCHSLLASNEFLFRL